MRLAPALVSLILLSCIPGCAHSKISAEGDPKLLLPGETHLANVRQITFGGTNAEAYWSYHGDRLTFQHKGRGWNTKEGTPAFAKEPECDQIYSMSPDGSDVRRVSNGEGRTTCSFFFPDDKREFFSGTFADAPECPVAPDRSHGYVWPIYNSYQIYSIHPDGTDVIPLEPGAPRAYNAEGVSCADGSIVFTSDRSGDLELYVGKLDPMGTMDPIKQITHTPGYDGGAVFSPDCKKIAWRASRPRPGKELRDYQSLLKQHLVRPTELEIWVADADGAHARQVTDLGSASFAPIFTPDGKRILFASNIVRPESGSFDLYSVLLNGTGLERVTYADSFTSFPMFSPDGKHLAFSSNRNASVARETNVFIADWVAGGIHGVAPRMERAEDRFQSAVETLSADSMQGRGVGTEGLKAAEKWVSDQYSEIGLKPYLAESFLQDVEFGAAPFAGQHANNVVGKLQFGKQCHEPIVIGAHLDHLGLGAEGSLEPSKTGIHHGADDNASGVAAILEVARILSSGPKPKGEPCFVFAAFTGEESGTVGSSRFVQKLKSLKVAPRAMLNLDMVGRMENNKLIVFGSDSAKEWHRLVDAQCAELRLSCPGGGDGYGPSDHMSFYVAKIPVLHFFTGPHLDYHRPSDTAEKINATGGIQTARAVAGLALAAAVTRLHYLKPQAAPAMGNLGGEHMHSKGAYLGTIPDYSALSSPHGPGGGQVPGGGVRLVGARPGSPADRAGIREGDVLAGIVTGLDSNPPQTHSIVTLDDFMKTLVALTPGEKVVLRVLRQGGLISLPATIGKREGEGRP